MVGRARVWRSNEGSKRRSRVEARATSESVGRDVIDGRKGGAVGLRAEEDVMLGRAAGWRLSCWWSDSRNWGCLCVKNRTWQRRAEAWRRWEVCCY